MLAWAAIAVLLLAASPPDSTEALAFQQITGGLGIGSSPAPRWCFHALDPRVEIGCPTELRPLPGVVPFCPHETMTLSADRGRMGSS